LFDAPTVTLPLQKFRGFLPDVKKTGLRASEKTEDMMDYRLGEHGDVGSALKIFGRS